jgi:hypothetical protein
MNGYKFCYIHLEMKIYTHNIGHIIMKMNRGMLLNASGAVSFVFFRAMTREIEKVAMKTIPLIT